MTQAHIPPLQRLRAFEATVRLHSFTLAARELALTQGAVSQHVRALETQIGEPLFTRTHQGAQPTATAHALALQVRQGLRIFERAFASSAQKRRKAFDGGTARPHLRLSVLPSLAARWLTPRLGRFQALHPQIDLDIRSSEILATLDGADKLDVAIRYGPGEWPGLEARKLWDEWLFPVASPAYRDGKLPKNPADLAGCTLLQHSAQPWGSWFQAAKVDLDEPFGGLRYSDAGLAIEAAISGQGVALARRSLVEADIEAGRLVRLWDISVRDVYAYFLVWREPNPKMASIRALQAWLLAEADQ